MRHTLTRPSRAAGTAIAPLALVLLATTASMAGASAQVEAEEPCGGDAAASREMASAMLYIEYNATDGDVGVHGAFDDDGWSSLCVLDPTGQPILVVDPKSQLDRLATGSIIFESREPPVEEFSIDDLMAAYPEGQYPVRGVSHDGARVFGEAAFRHAIPMPPTIVSPRLVDDEDASSEAVVPATDLLVTWLPVTTSVSGEPVVLTAYEVIVTKVDHDDPNGFSRPILDVHLPPVLDSFAVPGEFLEPSTVYELEILALEESGNQTISVGYFETAAGATAASALGDE